ncbi:P-loop containing nucleoside triphosphate hydrolase protein [Staphylotrichum tortipilum]|uniref:P-loop containing nucleoside triphosphate hydrolase protein n=1 Tax=Staphylotrichum tortipilum TaxID=2831512 RepID=A0AAN6RUJ3_9PEZI|nr:P-loop containing nucleoside triphosphate hydrolase protein [Staphylotrichum longicolle]
MQDRLPTVSAAQALHDLEDGDSINFISTGLPALDASLTSGLGGPGPGPSTPGGIQKGQLTEIWGPPGAGKTAFGIQLAASCLGESRGVVWVDGFHRVPVERLCAAVGSATGEDQDAGPHRLDGCFTHYTCPSLPHLIALLCKPTASAIPPATALVVVDSLSALVNHAFPKLPDRPARDAKGKGPSSSARRLQVLQYVVGSLQKLAATRDLAVVVLTQCATKMQAERGATLIPAINAGVWEQGISTRLVLFRDWLESRGSHFVAIQKLHGKGAAALADSLCPFEVDQSGLVPVECDDTQSRTLTSTPAQKRKLEDTDFEIADSEDEAYAWDDEEDLPPMPSQWQGSEDILLVRKPESDEEDHQDSDASETTAQEPDETEPAGEQDLPACGSSP